MAARGLPTTRDTVLTVRQEHRTHEPPYHRTGQGTLRDDGRLYVGNDSRQVRKDTWRDSTRTQGTRSKARQRVHRCRPAHTHPQRTRRLPQGDGRERMGIRTRRRGTLRTRYAPRAVPRLQERHSKETHARRPAEGKGREARLETLARGTVSIQARQGRRTRGTRQGTDILRVQRRRRVRTMRRAVHRTALRRGTAVLLHPDTMGRD